MRETKVTIKHPTGLHYRPAGLFVHTAKQFACAITLSCAAGEADAKSIFNVINLHVGADTEITVRCDGVDEDAALKALTDIVLNNFPGL
jgi:phosphocarrier protein HPr